MKLIVYPVLDEGPRKYSVQAGVGFLAPGYYRARGMCHTGTDYNDVRGGNTDLGAPVVCVAEGVVVDVGQYRGWGGIVLVHHAGLGVWTQYAHLNRIPVREGQRVMPGTLLGAIGRGDQNQFWAHLHFEVRRVLLPSYAWPSNEIRDRTACEAYIRARYIDPAWWLKSVAAVKSAPEARKRGMK